MNGIGLFKYELIERKYKLGLSKRLTLKISFMQKHHVWQFLAKNFKDQGRQGRIARHERPNKTEIVNFV